MRGVQYVNPVLDKLDVHGVSKQRLYRDSCEVHGTAHVKNLGKLRSELADTILIDNSPPSYLLHPVNAIPIASWFDDQWDTQLLDLCPVLESTLKNIPDVRCLLDANNKSFEWVCQQDDKPLDQFTVMNDLHVNKAADVDSDLEKMW